jgi:hypothetical protein
LKRQDYITVELTFLEVYHKASPEVIQHHFMIAALRKLTQKISLKLDFGIAFSINISPIKNNVQIEVLFDSGKMQFWEKMLADEFAHEIWENQCEMKKKIHSRNYKDDML